MKILNKIFILFSLLLLCSQSHADDLVIINEPANLSLDEIGLLGAKQGGLGFGLWRKSDGRFVDNLLKTMPSSVKSSAIKNLLKRALISVSSAPSYNNKKIPIVITKFKLLAKMGESESLGKMLGSIPENIIDEELYKIYFAGLFLNEDYDKACSHVESMVAKHNNSFWRENLIICQAVQGFIAAVDFNLSLLQEDDIKPSKSLQSFLAEFKKDKNKAKAIWAGILKEEVLYFENAIAPPPSVRKLQESELPQEHLQAWLSVNDDIDQQEKIEKIGALYILASGLDDKNHINQWQKMVVYSFAQNFPISEFVWLKLLDDAAKNQRLGEALLLMVHIIGGDAVVDISYEKMDAIVSALKNLGLKKELLDFSREFMFVPKAVQNTKINLQPLVIEETVKTTK